LIQSSKVTFSEQKHSMRTDTSVEKHRYGIGTVLEIGRVSQKSLTRNGEEPQVGAKESGGALKMD